MIFFLPKFQLLDCLIVFFFSMKNMTSFFLFLRKTFSFLKNKENFCPGSLDIHLCTVHAQLFIHVIYFDTQLNLRIFKILLKQYSK